MVSRCKATTVSGSPCSATPVRPSGWCYWHDPTLSAERDAARRRGGSARSNQARAKKRLPEGLLSVDEVRGLLGTALTNVLSGSLEPGPANAAAAIARAYIAATEAGAIEELTRRLDELEATARRGGAA